MMASAPGRETSRLHLLSKAQLEVLHWIAQGKPNAAIAIITSRSENTIRTHVDQILRRLEVENRVVAVLHYLKFTGRLRNFP